MDNQFLWVKIYKELAGKLLQYKNNRSELISNVVSIYENTGINMPTLELNNQLVDIDPFTVFGLFNKNSMRDENRCKILEAIKTIFEVEEETPTSFNGVPVLNALSAMYYNFNDSRKDNDIDELWELFSAALNYEAEKTIENREILSKYFDLAVNKKGNGTAKITMGLYWIAPETFLNLDSRNEWYIYDSGKILKEDLGEVPRVTGKITAENYFAIIEKVDSYLKSEKSELHDFMELSYEAWRYSEEVNKKEKEEKKRNTKGAGLADADVPTVHYWMYSVFDDESWEDNKNKGQMIIGIDEIGDYSQYATKEDIRQALISINPNGSHKNQALMAWNFAHEIQSGDIIFAKRANTLLGKGIVTGDYTYDDSIPNYKNYRAVEWQVTGSWVHPGEAVAKRLTDITAYTDYVETLLSIFNAESDLDEEAKVIYPVYTEEDFLNEVYMEYDDYTTLVSLIRAKKNVILQGAPGVGKTFAAKRLAYSMMGEKNQDRVQLIQFHQSYSYEDFIEGYRPTQNNGFEIKKGSFYKFCKKAADDEENDYFFIIDEINRGNLSKIFGELFMLIESDKRGNSLQLLYSDEKFYVPQNVYIIGMMNTADRSLAMIDYALRRRFAFYEMKPGFSSDGFRNYRMALGNAKFDALISCVEKLNNAIVDDDALGEGFCVGHSYFCGLSVITEKVLSNIVEYEIIPLLKEYWYDEPIKVKDWSEKLRSSIK